MQNCDKFGIILKVRIYVSTTLTPWPLEIKASPQSAFSAPAGSSLSESLKQNIEHASIA